MLDSKLSLTALTSPQVCCVLRKQLTHTLDLVLVEETLNNDVYDVFNYYDRGKLWLLSLLLPSEKSSSYALKYVPASTV